MEDKTQKKLKGSKGGARTWTWTEEEGIIWGQTNDFVGGTKIAMFDMDGNLITTKRGKGFARSADDWKWFDPCVPAKMKEYVASGHIIVIATNQMGISKGKTRACDIKTKIAKLSSEWDCPVAAMMAKREDNHRKPGTGMWDFYRDNMNDGIDINLDESFYVGDAAGRQKTNGRTTKDHGYGDRCFAVNVGIDFYTPEMFFLNKKEVLPPLPETPFQAFGDNDTIFVGDEYEIDHNNKHGKQPFFLIYSNLV